MTLSQSPGLGLAKQADTVIPGGIGPLLQPAPFRAVRQQDPGRGPYGGGDVSDAGVDRDDHVEIGDQRGGLGVVNQAR